MHNNLPLPLRPPSSISFLIEKKYPDNLEYFYSYLLYLMDFSSPHLNLYPPASNLNLTWKLQDPRWQMLNWEACRQEGGSLGPWRQHVSGKETWTAGEESRLSRSASRWRSGDSPSRTTLWCWFGSRMCRHNLAGLGKTHSSIFFTAQYLQSVPAFVAQNIPETPVKICENNWISPTFPPTYLHSTVHPQIRTFSTKRPSCRYWLRFVY